VALTAILVLAEVEVVDLDRASNRTYYGSVRRFFDRNFSLSYYVPTAHVNWELVTERNRNV
jgi:hypothetical protein